MDAIVIVRDWVTKAPVRGALVRISPEVGDPQELFTDETGEANFGEVLTGLYTVTAKHKDYAPGIPLRVELPATVHVELTAWWTVGVGVPIAVALTLGAAWYISSLIAGARA